MENRPGSFWRNYSIDGAVRYEHNFANQKLLNFWRLGTHFTHLNFWNANLNFNYMARALDDRSTRGGPLMERPANWRVNGSFHSDARKSVTFGVGLGGGKGRVRRLEYGHRDRVRYQDVATVERHAVAECE